MMVGVEEELGGVTVAVPTPPNIVGRMGHVPILPEHAVRKQMAIRVRLPLPTRWKVARNFAMALNEEKSRAKRII